MGFREFISEHTSLDPTRPANSLKNWFIGIPIGLGLLFGVVVEGNPLSKFVSSASVGARRALGNSIAETTPQVIEGTEALYGRPTQQGRQFQRVDVLGGRPNADCQEMNGWMYCPNRR